MITGDRRALVTGGMGFIGSNLIRYLVARGGWRVTNLDKLTYAANPANLDSIKNSERYRFVQGDIGDRPTVARLLAECRPTVIVNLAAETHVDRSILKPAEFIQANVVGVASLLDETLVYWRALRASESHAFRFVHVSTDEVYGALAIDEPGWDEDARSRPNSPYAASKAAADHIVGAYHHTYGLPALITRCSNNYGPFQHPEKLIPLMILNALQGKQLPLYGDGLHVRDWLYVDDHCAALELAIASGKPGEIYNIAGANEQPNIAVVKLLCAVLDDIAPSHAGTYSRLITHVADRPGHDRRYAMDCGKIRQTLDWQSRESFAGGIRKTVRWYIDNLQWVHDCVARDGHYEQWLRVNYHDR